MKPSVLLAIAILSAGVGLAIGTMIGNTNGSGGPHKPALEEKEILTLQAEIASLREAKSDAEAAQTKRIETLLAEVKDLEEKNAIFRDLYPEGEPVEPAKKKEAAAAAAAASPATGTAAYFGDRYKGVLKKVEWKTVGNNMGKMSKLIKGIVTAVETGERPDMKSQMEIGRLNQDLVKAGLTVQAELPGGDIQRAFSSAPFMVNAMASTLASVKMPLSEAQSRSILSIGEGWIAADEKRLTSYTDQTPQVQRLYEEAELKDRFFNDVFAVLSDEQEDALSPDISRGRVRVDIFSSSLIWVQRVRLLPFDDVKGLAANFTNRYRDVFDLDDAEKERAGAIIATWLNGIPSDLLFAESNALDMAGLVRTERVSAWGHHQVELIADLAHQLNFDENQMKLVVQIGGIGVPLKKPEE